MAVCGASLHIVCVVGIAPREVHCHSMKFSKMNITSAGESLSLLKRRSFVDRAKISSLSSELSHDDLQIVQNLT